MVSFAAETRASSPETVARRRMSPDARGASKDTSLSRRHIPRLRNEVTRPQVYIFGEIEGAAPQWPLTRLYCSWRLVYDATRWRLIQGEAEGETHFSGVGAEGLCVWNQPFAMHLCCRSLLGGWPRLEIIVRGADSHGRHQLAGYGSWALPICAGTSEALCRCWRPTGHGILSRLRSVFLGAAPELHPDPQQQQGPAPSSISDPSQGRAGLRTEDTVDVLLRVSVIHQDFEQNGLET